MLKTITYSFPQTTDANDFFKELKDLLGELPNATVDRKNIVIAATNPERALPLTIFTQRDISFPQIHLDVADLHLGLGNFSVNPSWDFRTSQITPLPKATRHDAHGEYIAVDVGDQVIFRLPITELCNRLQGHVTRIDHTGINLPSALVSREAWEQLIGKLADNCNLYRYPTGEDWPFILPATSEEFTNDIQSFSVGREPKFELVYDAFSPVPTIQIDIETDLLRLEIEQLFPEPYGISFPDLVDYFRTVYIDHEWPGLAICFDLRFKNNDPGGDWETGKWLVKDGGKIQ